MKYYSITVELLKLKRLIIPRVGEDAEKQEGYTAGGSVNWYKYSQKLNTWRPYDPAIQLLGTYPIGMGACVHQGTQSSNGQSSIVLNCQTPRNSGRDNWIVVYLYNNITEQWKRFMATCNNMDNSQNITL